MNEKSIISLQNSNHVALVAWGISIIFMENRNYGRVYFNII